MLIAQITDCHISTPDTKILNEVDTAARLEATVAFLNTLSPRPDLVIATGDLVHEGRPEEYDHLRWLLQPLQIPIYLLPGNHDNRDNLRAAFPDHAYLPSSGDLNWIVDRPALSIIGMDTVVPGQPNGHLSFERIAWLRQTLDKRPRIPTLLFMHHPPFLTGQEALDNIMCFGGDRLGALISMRPQIEAVLCGHHHQALVTRWAGVTAAIAPATAYQIAVDLEGRNPVRWTSEPAACMLHSWRRTTGLMSRVVTTEPSLEFFRETAEIISVAAE